MATRSYKPIETTGAKVEESVVAYLQTIPMYIQQRIASIETDIENELVKNVTSLLMELGTGFAFMGQQYHLEVGEKDFYIDLLFSAYPFPVESYFVFRFHL